ncbi:short chain enoyl-CoA hydratase [Halopseudomonas xinjiangensis]|uniref:Short chain enoyl-CoA hydratase n=1 Tax=Halopseudomonas xinjiangensis TaxID=487184 RepID=A0A1H1N2H6_9GAMM|nr:enoyl-CoA hydratase [Halopseudomonas xinjiangensis]SDR93162.1 short chain enoyl-CoA hydratase [Halopseudomonas xinjiangensis]
MSEHLLEERNEAVLTLTMHRPDKKNALTRDMYGAMATAINAAQEDASIRAVIIRGSAECFTSGNDVSDFLNAPASEPESPVYRFLKAICHADKPLIAAVNGPAVGVGTTMLLHCDLIYVAENARLKMPFVNLGLCPEAGSSFLLPRLLGHPRTAELLLLGEEISGSRAVEFGLANQALPAGQPVFDAAMSAARRIAELPPESMRLTKQLIKRGVADVASRVMDEEGEHFSKLLGGPEAREALAAFMQKRKPVFN